MLVILGLLGLAVVFLGISRIISRNVKKVKMKHRIPDGKITYSDLNIPAKPLFSKKYRIAGKPDYIIKKNKHYIPVELKTGTHNDPQKNHIFQLAGYCHLLEENYGGFVPYGIIVYNNAYQYKIPFDPRMRFELENTIVKMRNLIKTGKVVRNHNDPFRCNNCSMKSYCSSKLK
jgi:CRISPR-associated exonuclease Cas4